LRGSLVNPCRGRRGFKRQLNSNRVWLRESRGEKWRACQKVVRENGNIAGKS
jgi:hypothetical protein